MAVQYQGNTTNFSGVGAPNPKLWVPQINNIADTNTKEALLKIQQWCQNLTSPLSGFQVFSQTYSVSGTLVVPSGATGYLPPFFMPVSGQSVSLYAVIYEVRSGSCVINIEHNGTAISTGLTVSASPTETAVSAEVANNDTFQVVITSVSSADGLSCSFYFQA